ncbi:hypothetical protein COT75_01740 [Candidatus Beckwithbacteria bacterium CG10_big_fil_rev_8_21_14_0_10_34_10]|uniref:Methyltransferase type 11 domain-containing protein n=1 Tax=Candidatus Beckwithbacteria bacterium CG10_big_fil_rev_8_21_14_0_10_34_10 TaxID=1974495 RepID=A0A2H0W9N7_9BACT|nr:MAG: hypothetical protein COT75_01740 [Candidatus Beckwithbacteria bacterium CG10_big_fil_rev_8_21_14_0_10_34_10]
MAYKVFVPVSKNNLWKSYWQKSNYKKELELCKSDGLLPIFEKYLQKKQRIVEAGCGLGKWVIYFTKKGFNITGVDNNKYAILKLKKLFPLIKINLADVKKLPFKNNSFDAYISLGVIEHFEKGPETVLKEAYRVLKDRGTAIIEVPYNNWQRIILQTLYQLKVVLKTPLRILFEGLGLKEKRKMTKMNFYEHHYSRRELIGFIRRAGFDIRECFYKDDSHPQKSIGLWLDFPQFRKNSQADFVLTRPGQRLKLLYNVFKMRWFYSACICCVAEKPEIKGDYLK